MRGVLGLNTATPALPGGGSPTSDDPETAHWIRTNTRPQRQAGYRMATVVVPLGDLTGDQLRALAALAGRLGDGTVRLTNEQNLVVPWVPEGRLAELYRALRGLDLADPCNHVPVGPSCLLCTREDCEHRQEAAPMPKH